MKSTILGPHREAMSSSTPTTCPDFTAAIARHPGRAATLLRSCWQHLAPASTMRSGFEDTMNSGESWGKSGVAAVAASAMMVTPSSLDACPLKGAEGTQKKVL